MANGQSTYEIEIKTSADLKAAQDYRRNLEAARKVTQEMGKDLTVLNARIAGADKSLSSNSAMALKLEEALKKVSQSSNQVSAAAGNQTGAFGKLSEALKAAHVSYGINGGGLYGAIRSFVSVSAAALPELVALGGAFFAAKKAIEDYAEKEQALNSMRVALASQGKYSHEAAQGLSDMADKFELLSNIDDSKWISSLTQILQFGGDASNIDKIGDTLKNLTGILGGDLDKATTMVTRGMNGVFRGFEQVGFIVDKDKSKLETWTSIQKQAERGADLLRQQQDTLTGSWKGARVAVGNVSEAVGQYIEQWVHLKGLLQTVSFWTNKFADSIGMTLPRMNTATNLIHGFNKSLEDAGESTDQQAKRFEKMADKAERAAREVENVKKALSSLQKGQDDEASAAQDMEIAQVDDWEEANKGKPGSKLTASRRRYRIKARYAAEANNRQNETDIATLSASDRQADDLRKDRATVYGTEYGLKKSIRKASGFADVLTEKTKADEELRMAKDRLESLSGGGSRTVGGIVVPNMGGTSGEIQNARAAVASAQAVADARAQESAARQAGSGFNFQSTHDLDAFLSTNQTALKSATETRDKFDKNQGKTLEQLDIDRPQVARGILSRNRTFAYQSATSGIRENTEERGIRTELSADIEKNLQGGRGAGVFKELADKTAFIPEAIATAAAMSKLAGELVRVYGLTAEQVQTLQKKVSEIDARARSNRGQPGGG